MEKKNAYNVLCGGITPIAPTDCGGIPMDIPTPSADTRPATSGEEKPRLGASGDSITELVFIIDRSGSMSGFEADTIGGFNSLIEKQKREVEGTAYVTTVLFDTERRMLHDRIPLSEVEPMTRREYFVGGCTALLDALGEAITHIEKIHRYTDADRLPKNTVFVINTDGMENASREYSRERVKKMVEEKTECCGWEFIFLGANMDAIAAARDIGIRRERAAGFEQSGAGYSDCYEAMSCFISAKRCSAEAEALDSWKEGLENDENDDTR